MDIICGDSKQLLKTYVECRKAIDTVLVKDQIGDTGKYSYTYVSLTAILESITPVLLEHGFALSQSVSTRNQMPAVRTMLAHEQGIIAWDWLEMPMAQNTPQAVGSAITYARRYSLVSALGLTADDDDDGASAMPSTHRQESRPVRPPQRPPQRSAPRSQARPPANAKDGPCPHCNAPAGKPHATNCPNREQAAPQTSPPAQGEREASDGEMEIIAQLVAGLTQEEIAHYGMHDSAEYQGRLALDDQNSGRLMYTTPSPGKKMSQYQLLAWRMDEAIKHVAQENQNIHPFIDHKHVLSALLGRPVSSDNPPGMDCKWLLDELMSDETLRVLTVIEETAQLISQEMYNDG